MAKSRGAQGKTRGREIGKKVELEGEQDEGRGRMKSGRSDKDIREGGTLDIAEGKELAANKRNKGRAKWTETAARRLQTTAGGLQGKSAGATGRGGKEHEKRCEQGVLQLLPRKRDGLGRERMKELGQPSHKDSRRFGRVSGSATQLQRRWHAAAAPGSKKDRRERTAQRALLVPSSYYWFTWQIKKTRKGRERERRLRLAAAIGRELTWQRTTAAKHSGATMLLSWVNCGDRPAPFRRRKNETNE